MSDRCRDPRPRNRPVGPDGKRQHTVAEMAEAVGVHRTTVAEMAEAVGVHRTTVYDYLNKEG
jgi:AcrR family transcriptional regulator